MRSEERLARLKELSAASNANLFERIGLADQLLKDQEWCRVNYKSELDAIESIGKQYFRQVCGWLSLGQLLDIYDTYRDESVWKTYDYDLRAMYDLTQARKKKRPNPSKKPFVENDSSGSKSGAGEHGKSFDELKVDNSVLMQENKSLKEENEHLKRRVAMLERKLRGAEVAA